MEFFESHPLARFSIYTYLQQQVLERTSAELCELLDNAFIAGRCVSASSLNEVYGQFWLWTLGAYEMVRTMAPHKSCFSPQYAEEIFAAKQRLATLRMPFAKQELKGRRGSALNTEASIAQVDTTRRDAAFIINSECYWIRVELERFQQLLDCASTENVLRPMGSRG